MHHSSGSGIVHSYTAMIAPTNNQEQFWLHSIMSARNDRITMKKKDHDKTCSAIMGTIERLAQTRKQRRATRRMINEDDDEQSSSSTQHSHQRRIQPSSSANYSIDQVLSSMMNQKQTQESKKGVRISNQIAVGFTMSHRDMSPDEKSSVWYSGPEYNKITHACLKQIQKLDHGEILKEKKYCARGLENKTHIVSIAQEMHRNLAYKVVFEEQDRQRRESISEPECIASLYNAVSSSSQLWANVVALKDQRLADDAANEENKKESCRKWNNKTHSCMDDRASPKTCCEFFILKEEPQSSPRFPSRIPQTIELAMAA